MVKLSLISAVVWTLLSELALQGLRAPLTVIPAVVAPGRGEAGLDGAGGFDRAAAAATAVTDEMCWGHERRARRWREAAALQRRRHVASLAPKIADCGYIPQEPWTSASEPHKHRSIVRENVGPKKRGRVKGANPLYKGCSVSTAINVDVDVDIVVLN
jgi:hypothetical protein